MTSDSRSLPEKDTTRAEHARFHRETRHFKTGPVVVYTRCREPVCRKQHYNTPTEN